MKRSYTILTAALVLLAFLALPMGMKGQTRTEVVAYTLEPVAGSNNSYAGNCDITIDEITWNLTGNSQQIPWRIGGKNLVEVDRTLYSKTPIQDNVTKIEVTHGSVTLTAVNSWTVIVASDASFNTIVSTLTPTFTANATTTINRPDGADWSNCYYKFVYNVTAGSSNQYLQFSGAVFYKQEGSGPVIATPTFSPVAGTYTETQNVTISCETQGSTIYYTTDGSTPDNTSTPYDGAITVSETTTINAIAYVGNDASNVATATYTIVNLEHAGTEADPYSVADARTAIDANVGITGVYATGIVSAIPTAYNSSYGNVTFNMVDEEGDEDFLQAYRCASGTGVDASQVAVGDVVVVYGDLTKYGSTYEFNSGCQLVSLTHPTSTEPSITVTPATLHVEAGQHVVSDELTITFDNIDVVDYESFTIQFYNAEGEGQEMPEWLVLGVLGSNDEGYQVNGYISANESEARSSYFKVHVGETYSNLVTINQAAYVAPTYAELPFAFNNGKDAIEETDGLSQEGLGSDYSTDDTKLKFDGTGDWLLLQFNERPGTLTFKIKGNSFSGGTFKVQTSENGETYVDLAEYTELGDVDTKTFDNLGENVRYIKWIYTNKASGNVGLGTITLGEYVEPQPSITVTPATLHVEAGQHVVSDELTITFDNIDVVDYESFTIQFYNAEGEGQEMPEWLVLGVLGSNDEGYQVNGYISANESEARSSYFKVHVGETYSNLVTINQAAPVVPPTPGNWVLTDLADLTEDDVFVIVGDNGDTYAMSNDKGTSVAPAAVAITVVEGTLSEEPAANLQWNISIGENSYTFYPNGETETWLYCANSNNGVRVGTNENSIFTMSEEGYLFNTATRRYIGIYNSQDWRCYTSINSNITGQTFAFYKKVTEPVTTYTLTIDGYAEGNVGGYHLIASPVTVDPSTNGMTEGNFDLYYFNQAEQDEWRNWKEAEGGHFNLVPGTGYLYAKQATTDNEVFQFTLTGTPYEGYGTVMLTKLEGVDWSGLNLVGNPFNEIAYIDREFYTMNDDGSAIIPATNNSIQAMEGIFVYAGTNGEEMQFSTEVPAEPDEKIIMNVTRNRGNVVDRAIVRFGQGGVLPKFQLNPNSTKLYMTEGNQEFAVVRSANEGELPVSFKASENGNYTLNIETENVEVSYLHLIDNKTGVDTDLLATPSYTFEANTTDYANRFKLVFTTGSLTGSDTFAYFNGNEWVINNEGEATLQVVDVTGRVLSNEQINGSYNNSLNLSAGVYVLRLSNGNVVKTQKVVID